ncbi:sensor histidine kinase [Longivirga aurantiaca]|uniref:Oxygen sensor histidine kinase NreB n=1 Tax=Longivirga aurantiaca TaxID=1837743 RepID=A0ABW1SZK9_9ACTN
MTGTEERDFAERTLVGWHVLFGAMVVATAVLTALNGSAASIVPLLMVLVAAYLLVWFPRQGCASLRRSVPFLVVACVVIALMTYRDPASLVILFAIYPLGFVLLERRGAIIATVAITLTFTLTLAARDGFSRDALLLNGFMAVGNIVFALVIGLFIDGIVRESRARKQLLEQLQTTQGELAALEREAGAVAERERLARDIHDTLAQGFTSIVMLSQAGETAAADGQSAEAVARLRQIQETAREGLAEARALVGAMTPPALEGDRLPDALARLVDRFSRDTGIASTFCVEGEAGPLSSTSDVVALRATQEALANVRKHAGATRVDVVLHYDEDGATVSVSDDGAGFDPAAPRPGYGLDGLAQRVESVGGLSSVESTPGAGTRVRVRVP